MEHIHRWIEWWWNLPRLLRWPAGLRRDVAVFLLIVYLYFVLLGATVPITLFLDYPSSPSVGPVTTTWLWVVATPALVAKGLGYEELGRWLMLFNALIYGATWWLVWRMWTLFRRKRAE